MQRHAGFLLFDFSEVQKWLTATEVTRRIETVQEHHAWSPNYSHFSGDNHFKLQDSMKNTHLECGFADIAQHLSIFPDGKISTGRPLNRVPAGIKEANTGGVCIESIGVFDADGDAMTSARQEAIIQILCCGCAASNHPGQLF